MTVDFVADRARASTLTVTARVASALAAQKNASPHPPFCVKTADTGAGAVDVVTAGGFPFGIARAGPLLDEQPAETLMTEVATATIGKMRDITII